MLERFVNLIEERDGIVPFDSVLSILELPLEPLYKWYKRCKIRRMRNWLSIEAQTWAIEITDYTIYVRYKNCVPRKPLIYVLVLLGKYECLNQLSQAWDRPLRQGVTYCKYYVNKKAPEGAFG